ncbi:hypothetical protein DRF65_06895 [Chryseobacterium pennae]|uniref:Carboxypeptidase regulatory-like domain-containing protein n=1 Tax=Chryseobacterium pennae TaxID=2258962 RepID=A0A3D9CAQ4_9FLAO|nr:hypothetical protein [Chryseobacterium pennae]REC62957.1 hypothetical protein DRF65_06895 [Chryseobacterium pennae]
MRFIFFLLFSTFSYAQSSVSGNTVSEQGYIIQKVLVINVRTNEQKFSDTKGFFNIKANINDELRFVKENYERSSRKIFSQDFSNLISVTLIQKPTEIEEVTLAFNSSGDIKKDMNFNSSKKTAKLNNDISEYLKKPMAETQPKNNIPSSFAPRNPYEGQLNLLSISSGGTSGGLVGFLLKQSIKKNVKPTYAQIQEFYKKIKNSLYGDYFVNNGLNEFEFEEYVIHIDRKYNLSEKYWNNFKKNEIDNLLKKSIKDYLKNKK